MTLDQFFMLILGGACGGLGWFARELYTAINKLKDDLALLRERIGTDYVRYDRLRDAMGDAMKPVIDTLNEIRSEQQRIREKLEKRDHP
jgi:hypothetical protein